MDLMINSKAVRLRSHLDKYLVANDDGTTVRQSRNCITRRSIWIVQPTPGPTGASSVRLKNYSTGLYLAASDVLAFLMTGKRVVQSPLFSNNNDKMISFIFDWTPIKDVDGSKIRLKARGAHGKFLRANGGPPPWNNSVTHDGHTTGATKFWTLWDVVPVEAPEYSEDEQGKKVKSSPLQFHINPASLEVPQLPESDEGCSNLYSTTNNTTSSSVISVGDYVQPPLIVRGGVRAFTHEELSHATNTFSRDNILGHGGFGIVYRGVLSDGDVAVKQLQIGISFQGEREFVTEIKVLSRIHHKNLVSLVGYCVSGPERLLVYEYVENNSLAFHLQGNATSVLNWPTRMRIALDAAKGIAYLHEECHPKIVHRDIKSANILVDSNFRAKVSDFGLAKFVLDDKIHVTTRIVGSFGYLDPEFVSSGNFTNKSDVYSFGVVLLELITGRKPTGLVDWARPFLDQALEDGEVKTGLSDPKLRDNYDHEKMNCMVACAAVSVSRFPDSRPQMSQVVQVLEGNVSPEKLKAETSQSRKRRFI